MPTQAHFKYLTPFPFFKIANEGSYLINASHKQAVQNYWNLHSFDLNLTIEFTFKRFACAGQTYSVSKNNIYTINEDLNDKKNSFNIANNAITFNTSTTLGGAGTGLFDHGLNYISLFGVKAIDQLVLTPCGNVRVTAYILTYEPFTLPNFTNTSHNDNGIVFYTYTTLSKFQFDVAFPTFSLTRNFFTYS
jgi:hypothetical protein